MKKSNVAGRDEIAKKMEEEDTDGELLLVWSHDLEELTDDLELSIDEAEPVWEAIQQLIDEGPDSPKDAESARAVDEDDVSVTLKNAHLLTMIKEGKINQDKAKLIEEILPKIQDGRIPLDELIDKYDAPDLMLANKVWGGWIRRNKNLIDYYITPLIYSTFNLLLSSFSTSVNSLS